VNFTLPPGVEVPELQRAIDRVQYYTGASAIDALCRVVREQDRMLRTEVAAHCVNGERSPDGVDRCSYCKGRLDALRRRVREEAEDE
jgi:hypothetical protein